MDISNRTVKKLFFRDKKLSLIILGTSVASSLANCIGLSILMPVLFFTFDLNMQAMGMSASKFAEISQQISTWSPINPKLCLLLGVISILLLKNVLVALRVKFLTVLMKKNLLSIRSELLTHLFKKDLTYFLHHGSGKILNHLVTNVDKSAKVMADTIELFGMSFQLFAYGAVLFYISPKLMMICMAFAIPLMILVRRLSSYAKGLSMEQSKDNSILSQNLSDLLHGIRFVKLASRESEHLERINKISEKIQYRMGRIIFISNINQPIAEMAASFLLLALMMSIYLSQSSGGTAISAPSFLSFLVILARALPLFNIVANKKVEIANNAGSLHVLEDILADESHATIRLGKNKWKHGHNKIIFDNVSFHFTGVDRNVLNNVGFEINAGENVAIVGPSGSGKSTLVDIFLRFYEPSSGGISIDDMDYRDIEITNFRKHIGLVPQEPILFFSTIRNNLMYLKPEATEIEIWRALDQADLADFISSLPNGLDTEVGERGVQLSGGQRQRLCIARALLMEPEILIFDEATSSLDSISESKIVESIQKISKGRTTITIAHRLATILHCDRVFLIEHGWLIESGSVKELMIKNSRFRKFAEAQNLRKAG